MPSLLLTTLRDPHHKITSQERVHGGYHLWTVVLGGPDVPLSSIASFRFSPPGGEVKTAA